MAKQLVIEKVEASTLVRIVWTGGGEVPDALKGSYTTRAEAQRAIVRWQAANPEKAEVQVVEKKEEEPAPKTKKGLQFEQL